MSYGMPLLFIAHILAGTAGFAQGSISIDVRSQADVPTCYSVTKHIRWALWGCNRGDYQLLNWEEWRDEASH